MIRAISSFKTNYNNVNFRGGTASKFVRVAEDVSGTASNLAKKVVDENDPNYDALQAFLDEPVTEADRQMGALIRLAARYNGNG